MEAIKATVEDYTVVERTQEWIKKINTRAERNGWSARFELQVERTETERQVHGDGLTVMVPVVQWHLTVVGTTMKYNGWELLAVLDWEGADVVVRTVPGIEFPRKLLNYVAPRSCDHCKVYRERNDTFLIRHEDGEIKAVGSTCLKDFLGWEGRIVFPAELDASAVFAGGAQLAAWPTDQVLAIALACIREYGWRKSSELNSTRDAVADVLNPFNRAARERAQELAPKWHAILESGEVDKIREATSVWHDSENLYERNVHVITTADYITGRNLGIAASAPLKYWRDQEEAIREKLPKAVSAHVGKPKERITVTVKVVRITPIEKDYGTTYLYTMLDEKGNVYKWFASGALLGETVDDEFFQLVGTVKVHEIWMNEKQTVLTRCKEKV